VTEALPAMIQALGLEIAAIRKKGGGNRIQLRGGERVGRAGETWLYRFIVAEDLNIRDDTPVRVTSGQEDVAGMLVSFRDGVLLVSLEQDLGPKIALAHLVANDSFLVERLRDQLERVHSGELQLNREAAERVLGLSLVSVGDAEPAAAVLQGGRVPNEDQVRAVRRSVGSDTTYIWGPPGTGKTTTLARIVEANYRTGRTVLLVSNTSIAVDTALEKVAERLTGEPEFYEGLVIRQGPVVKDELRQRFGPQVILDDIVARLGEALRREKDDLLREAAGLEVEERSLAAVLQNLERLARVRQELAHRQQAMATAQAQSTARAQQAAADRGRVASLEAALARAQGMGAVRRLLSGLDPGHLEGEIGIAKRAVLAAESAARALAAEAQAHEAGLQALRREFTSLVATTGRHPPAAGLQSRIKAIRKRLDETRERVAAIDAELAALEQEVLARCRILATTVYRTYLGPSGPRQFDVVVIDEASMLMPPLVYYVAGLAAKAVTVAGDFRQLPPIVASDQQLAADWLKRDVFEKAGIAESVARHRPTPHLVALSTQYRVREEICGLINGLFYADHPLRTDPSVSRRESSFPLGGTPLVHVDTSPFRPWTALRVGTFLRYNLFHALLVRNIVLHLAETGYLPAEGPNETVGAVSRYASQARLIQALLIDRLGDRAAGISATVHRFQGNEKATMIIDLTDSLGARLGAYLKGVRVRRMAPGC
jgi:KaiC/GvpD/RAD55 family RecA-like ATPase